MKIIKFVVRVLLLVSSVFVIAFGSALCIRANVGCIPVSVGPYVWTSAGGMSIGGFRVPEWTVGAYTFIIYAVCFFLQIILLRRKYQPLQLFQFVIAVFAGYFLDLSMDLTEIFQWQSVPISMIQLLIGDFIIGFGILISMVFVGYCVSLLKPFMSRLETKLY